MATAAEPIEQVKERIDLIANTKAREEVEAGAKLIDVREPHEWDEAHLEGAIHVPQGELLDRIDEVAPDHSERIVLYCRTDNRSTRAADALRDLGYDNVAVMAGGIVDWQEDGLPVVAAKGAHPRPADALLAPHAAAGGRGRGPAEAAQLQGAADRRRRARRAVRVLPRGGRRRHDRDRRRRRRRRVEPPAPGDPQHRARRDAEDGVGQGSRSRR